MPIFQYQARPSVPLIADTNPPQVAGMAWFTPFVDPFFPTVTKPWLHQTESRRIAEPPPPAAPSGIPWLKAWEPPFFRGYPADRQQTEFYFQSPTTLPVGISGQAWYKSWEPPFFSTTTKVFLHQTQAFQANLSALAPAVAGISWMLGWEPPYFKGYPAALQQSEMFVKTREYLPPLTAGMWWKPFDQPFFSRVTKIYLQTAADSKTLIPGTLPPRIAGMAWYAAFDQPKQRKVDFTIQKTSIQGRTSVIAQTSSYSIYIIF